MALLTLLLLQHHATVGPPGPATWRATLHLPLLLLGVLVLLPGPCACACCQRPCTCGVGPLAASKATWPLGRHTRGTSTRRALTATRQWRDAAREASGPVRLAPCGHKGLCWAKQAAHRGAKGPSTKGREGVEHGRHSAHVGWPRGAPAAWRALLLPLLLLSAADRGPLLLLGLLLGRALLLLLVGTRGRKHVGTPCVVEAVHGSCQVGWHWGRLEQRPVRWCAPHACHCCYRCGSCCCRYCWVHLPTWRPLRPPWTPLGTPRHQGGALGGHPAHGWEVEGRQVGHAR
jgi:hypothetical protein